MATRRTTEFLDGQKVKYAIIRHSPAYTAQEVAASVHIPGKSMAKSVVVDIDGRLALAVVPAHRDVDTALLRSAAGAERVTVAELDDFAVRFEGCQLGTMPPLGNLFGMETFVDKELAKQDYIAFNAGSHTDVVTMRFNDYRKIAHPKLTHIATEGMPGVGAMRFAQL